MLKNCTLMWCESHHVRAASGRSDVEKVRTVAARFTFPSKKNTKHPGFGPLLEVRISKDCTPLWREAHFQLKTCKTQGARASFGISDAEKMKAVAARNTWCKVHFQVTSHKTSQREPLLESKRSKVLCFFHKLWAYLIIHWQAQ